MYIIDWNEQAKRLLKSELVRRGVTTENLVELLSNIGVKETRASIESKISRGTFSAAFFLQCLNAIGCKNLYPELDNIGLAAEDKVFYKSIKPEPKRTKK